MSKPKLKPIVVVDSNALVSTCGKFRYWLYRIWDESLPTLVFIMLNPSTADARENDQTVRKCMGFAQHHGYGGIVILNLYAFRARRPTDLKAAGYPVGPDADMWINWFLDSDHKLDGFGRSMTVVCAWGANAAHQSHHARIKQVMSIVDDNLHTTHCLATGHNNVPRHPLMLSYANKPTIWWPAPFGDAP
jgi:hypothetical protein